MEIAQPDWRGETLPLTASVMKLTGFLNSVKLNSSSYRVQRNIWFNTAKIIESHLSEILLLSHQKISRSNLRDQDLIDFSLNTSLRDLACCISDLIYGTRIVTTGPNLNIPNCTLVPYKVCTGVSTSQRQDGKFRMRKRESHFGKCASRRGQRRGKATHTHQDSHEGFLTILIQLLTPSSLQFQQITSQRRKLSASVY